MAATVRVTHRIDPRVEALLMRSDNLRNDLLRRGVRVLTAARDRLGSNPRRIDTGRLRSSISIREFIAGSAWGVAVGTDVEYAVYVHEGTRYMEANPFLKDALSAARR